MKKIFILLTLISFTNLVSAQRLCKKAVVHAYIRNSMPGNFPQRETAEEGNISKPVRPVSSYHIYLEDPRGGFTVNRIWINGESYNVTTEKVNQTPIIVAGGQVGKYQKNDTIHTRSSKVLRILVKEKTNIDPPLKISDKIRQNAVVVEFSYGKRSYYNFSSQLKKLQPVVLQ